MARKISASVGSKGKNAAEDVKTVQDLINPFAAQVGFAKLKVDGTNTPKLEKAIMQFQEQICGFKPDGRVDPGKNTLRALNAGPSRAKAEQKAAEKAQQKVKDDARAKALAAARAAAEKQAKAVSMDKGTWAAFCGEIEKHASELYDTCIASADKTGEPAEKAAPRISDMVAKSARKKIDEAIKKIEAEQPVLKPGRVTGKINGVNKKIIDILQEVSSHYGETIEVVSGLRDRKGQASAMFGGWKSHLKRGKAYIYLQGNEKLRLELDAFVEAGDKAGFTAHMMKNADWKKVSMHLTGDAADVTTRTNPKIIKAIATVLHYYPESNSEGIKCHHFDVRKTVWPISDKVKEKWAI